MYSATTTRALRSTARRVGGYRDVVTADSERVDDLEGDLDGSVEQAWTSQDRDALRLAFETYGSLVFTYCLQRLGDRARADDCVQETFVSAWKARRAFDPVKGSLAAWLLGIARYRVADVYRAQARVAAVDVRARSVADAEADDGSTPDDVATKLLIAHVLTVLAPRPRQVVELAFFSELSQSEIADTLGVPLGTVKSDMRRALRRLRIEVEGGGS